MLSRKAATTVLLTCALALGTEVLCASTITPPKSSGKKQATSKSLRYKKFGKRRSSWKNRGQKAIDKERAREIQLALIRENYLSGEASGLWDTRTKQAMKRYQAAHGWQTKMIPDSRALIELGLGPKHDDIINPETAMTPTAVIAPVTSTAAQR